ncbi:MAG: hypothetical protein ABI781_06140 [Burkholderiales bacterium]
MIKSLVLAAVTAAGALGANSANAGVSWSVGIDTPVVGTVVSGGPGYYRSGYGPGYYRPAYRRVYAPVPVYRVAPPVAYYPAPIYYRPAPVVYPRYYPAWRHGYRDGYGRR